MQNLDFKSWLESGVNPPTYKPKNTNSVDRIKDFRMMHNGPFTGFRDPPKILRRFGGDVMTGMQQYAQHVKGDLTSQEPNRTYDVGHELKYNIEERGKSIIITIPCTTQIFYNTDDEGNLLDKRGEITSSIKDAEYAPDKEFKKKARDYFNEYIRNNEGWAEKLKEKHADLNTVTYVDYKEIDGHDEHGNEMVDLVFSTSINDNEFANTVFRPRRS